MTAKNRKKSKAQTAEMKRARTRAKRLLSFVKHWLKELGYYERAFAANSETSEKF